MLPSGKAKDVPYHKWISVCVTPLYLIVFAVLVTGCAVRGWTCGCYLRPKHAKAGGVQRSRFRRLRAARFVEMQWVAVQCAICTSQGFSFGIRYLEMLYIIPTLLPTIEKCDLSIRTQTGRSTAWSLNGIAAEEHRISLLASRVLMFLVVKIKGHLMVQ